MKKNILTILCFMLTLSLANSSLIKAHAEEYRDRLAVKEPILLLNESTSPAYVDLRAKRKY